jgi:hypothetical protein
MSATVIALFVTLLLSPQNPAKPPSPSMDADVDRLVQAAEKLTGAWPAQAPPPIPEVSLVARHGTRVAPLLTTLLSNDPSVERDRKRWKVQQQAALALCLVYSESKHCGRTYCDGDSPERIGRVKEGGLTRIESAAGMARQGSCSIASSWSRCSGGSSRSGRLSEPDTRRSNFGDLVTVAEAARRAIAVISPLP